MAGTPELTCALCGEPVPRGARRCDNCGSVIPEPELEDLKAFMDSLKVDSDTARKLYESGYLLPEGEAKKEGSGQGGMLYLCPTCGAFVSSADTRCRNCGADLAEEVPEAPPAEAEAAIPDVCPECGSLAPTGRRTCAVCGASLRPGKAATPTEARAAPAAPPPKVVPRPATPRPQAVPARPAARPQAVAARPKPELRKPSAPPAPRAAPPVPKRAVAKPAPKPKAERKAEGEARPLARAPPPQPSSRLSSLREIAAIGTAVALPVAAGAAYANVPGHEWGQLFLFGVLFGIGLILTLPDLRPSGGGRVPVLAALAGVLLLAATPTLGYLAGPSIPLESGLLVAGLIAIAIASWRLWDGAGIFVAWTAGLLLLAFLAVGPLSFASPGATANAQWVAGGGLALGAAILVALRRWLRYAADARLLQGDAEYARREYEKAIASYDASIALARRAGREASAGWYGRGASLVAVGRLSEAIDALDRALALNPGNEIAWINKGTALSRLGRLNDALRCYNSAIKVNPKYEVAWNNKGNALARIGKHDLALSCYERALQIDPAYRTAWVNKGFVLAKLGRFEEAAECADAALRLTTGAAASA